MSMPVFDEKKILEINDKLIKLGKKRGYLTYDEINNSFAEVQLDPEMISSFLDLYESEQIDIVKAKKVVETPKVKKEVKETPKVQNTEEEQTTTEEADFEENEEEENIPADFKIEEEDEEPFDAFEITSQLKLSDPVHMYLKEIGRVELLSSQEEIKFAK